MVSESPVPPTHATRWWWRYGDGEGRPVETTVRPSPVFSAQAEAESWVGEFWRELLAGGVDSITLMSGDRVVYGPMSLHPMSQ